MKRLARVRSLITESRVTLGGPVPRWTEAERARYAGTLSVDDVRVHLADHGFDTEPVDGPDGELWHLEGPWYLRAGGDDEWTLRFRGDDGTFEDEVSVDDDEDHVSDLIAWVGRGASGPLVLEPRDNWGDDRFEDEGNEDF